MSNELNLIQAYKIGLEKEKHILIDIDISDNWDESILHVSDLRFAAEDCPRALKLRLMGKEKQEPTMGQIIMWRTGHVQEELAKRRIEVGLGNGWAIAKGTFQKEKQLLQNLPDDISGQYDMLLTGEKLCVIDIKTVRGGAFYWLDADGARKGNIAQVQGYMHALGVNMGKLFYVDREGQNAVREFDVERNDKWVEESYEYLRSIRDTNVLPSLMPIKLIVKELKTQETLYMDYPFQCRYCEYNGVSCEGAGALPEKFKRITKSQKIGQVKNIIPKRIEIMDEYTELANMVKELYYKEAK